MEVDDEEQKIDSEEEEDYEPPKDYVSRVRELQ
jgi:hypothetical protein